ncbi:cobyrinate a,c-diamide synthase [Geovibrio thiophilus]|uniref:Cobyrinate a,c-diamide synthase n=1 Tax=Geovibrio thiophilus TaxID=139438 RepID=A0A3R5XX81_9BACT|nr:cobyrinate a,c-diamide synthase [Geovibrio thiophilus]QAR33445.1 cobyrinate a,c-diamide synthase [Geovibrio thiophilus]
MNGFVIGAEKSGSGKTTLTTGIIRALADSGRKVAPFKCGPDYIDTRHLTRSAGHTAENLDTVMLDDAAVKQIFAEGCRGRDVAVAEGVMGFFDGVDHTDFKGSTYDIASTLGLPAVIVLNAASSSYTAAAFLKGIEALSTDAEIAGVIINNTASLNHEKLITDAVKHHTGLTVFGSVPKQAEPLVKSRHLGIATALETEEEYYAKCAGLAAACIDINSLAALKLTKPLTKTAGACPVADKLCAVAFDHAFSFYYEANFRELRRRGYEIRFFSPLKGETVEDADLVYIGGGYPELYVRELAAQGTMLDWLREHALSGGRMVAECGGMMLLTDGINIEDEFHRMAGVFDAECRMTDRRQALGYVRVTGSGHLNGLVGHEFHYSMLENVREKYLFTLEKVTSKARSEDGFLKKNTLAGYVHFHFASNPSVLDFILK